MFRHISLRDFVTMISAELAIPEDELYEDDFLCAAKSALDAPASRIHDRQGIRGRERHPTIPTKFAALVDQLLRDPPLPEYAARVAMRAGDELLRRGRARRTGDRARTIVRFEQWARNPRLISKRALAQSVGPAGGRRAVPQSDALFDDRPAEEIGIYLAGPLQVLRDVGATDVIAAIHEGCEAALAELTRDIGGVVRFRLIHPSHDDPLPDADDMWDWDLGLLEEAADVLVVADLGRYAISFGVACEIGRFRQLPGELIHFRSAMCEGHSSYLEGLTREVGMDAITCRNPFEIPHRMKVWVKHRMPTIIDAARRRDDAVVLATPAHRRLVRNWRGLSTARREAVRDAADLNPARMIRVLESAAAFAALPGHATRRLDALVIDDRTRSSWRGNVDVDNLLAAATRGRWPADETSTVLAESRKRVSDLRAAATRADQSVSFFQGVHRDLYGS
jgi:hypothetical protein